MKKFLSASLIFTVFAAGLVFSSEESLAMILEHKDTLQFKVQQLPDQVPLKIKVSGLSGHSALSVSKITTEINGSVLIIYVHLTLATISGETSGRFDYELIIPDSINEIKFGKKKVSIWKRNKTSR